MKYYFSLAINVVEDNNFFYLFPESHNMLSGFFGSQEHSYAPEYPLTQGGNAYDLSEKIFKPSSPFYSEVHI